MSCIQSSRVQHNGDAHHGYKTDKEETLFYDFAVQGYDLMISYQDKFYYFMVDDDGVWLSDDAFTAKTGDMTKPDKQEYSKGRGK
ncbi:hypothetical protein [Segatella bryantii]|uniref:hypothetical protein n=1 Tax=Segatella bryantii TaxID=77095 RepID=UPI0028536C2C|nr:hypothetical protein [Segatella bryantii]MDR4931314.1 hypothetical protein [Segatella bryantii]